ncbi:MAG: flagellar hook-length control protein FliK [Phycisphaerales bacterium]|nr:flagellar hook-length control protein FliK [Phycisphaerales bacterium]
MPADVQQLIKTTRSTPAKAKKPAANGAGEDFGQILKQANKPKPKPSPDAEQQPQQVAKKQEPAKTESADHTAESAPEEVNQAEAQADPQTDAQAEHPDEHHEPTAEEYVAAAQVVTPQPVVLKQNEPTKSEPQPQSAVSQAEPTAVVALNGQMPDMPDHQSADKTTPPPVATNPQASPDPAAQAKPQPALTLGQSVATSSDDSDSPSTDHHKAQQANPLPNPDSNAMNAEMAVAQTAAAVADTDHSAVAKSDLNNAKIDLVIAPLGDSVAPKHAPAATNNTPAVPLPTAHEAQFAQDNHPKIITALRSEIAGSNGTMHIRLDPPELGALQVTVRMRDGIMSAAFETSNDEATKLLSRSMTQLKQVLESQGVSIDKLHVQQSSRSDKPTTGDEHQQQHHHQDGNSARQDQQRKEMIRRMWRRLGVGNDPLDLVA